jgi:PAS domain S-box-containing protein
MRFDRAAHRRRSLGTRAATVLGRMPRESCGRYSVLAARPTLFLLIIAMAEFSGRDFAGCVALETRRRLTLRLGIMFSGRQISRGKMIVRSGNESVGKVRRPPTFSAWAEAMLTQSSDGIVIFGSADGAVIDFNDQAAIRLAYSHDEFCSLTAADLLVWEEPASGAALLATIEAAGTEGVELKQRAKDGTLRDVRARCVRVEEGGQSFVVATLQDLTEQKRRDAEREREHLWVVRRDRVRERFNDAIVHAPDMERMLELALDVVLEELGWDRVSLVLMPDGDVGSLAFSVQRTRPEFPGPRALGIRVSIMPAMRECLAELAAGRDVIQCDAERVTQIVAPETLRQFAIKALVMIAVRPRIGGPWSLALSAANPRTWNEEDQEIVRDLVPRLEDALTAKLAQDELRQSLKHLETAQRRARIGSWELDVANQRGVWSEQMFALYSRERSLGHPSPAEVLELVHPDDRAYIESTIGEFIASTDEQCVMDTRTNPARGPVRMLRNIVGREIRDERLFLVGTAQDVTDQLQAEELSARLDDLLKQLDVGVFSYTPAGENLELNDALVRLLDCHSAAEATQLGYRQVLFGRAESQPGAPPMDPGREREVRVTTPAGRERVLRIATRSVMSAGKIYRIDGIVNDVTGPRMAERRARDAAVAAAKVATLTARERDVLDRVVAGEANKVIARGLDLSEKTVEKHRASLMRKTGAKSVAELVRLVLIAQKESGV